MVSIKEFSRKWKSELYIILCGVVCLFVLMILLLPISYSQDWYNLTNFTNKNDMVGMFQQSNTYTDSIFGFAIYLGFFFVLLISFSKFGAKDAFAGSTFIIALVGLILTPLNIIPPILVIASIVGSAGMFVSLLWR